jgi:hypothetical protein
MAGASAVLVAVYRADPDVRSAAFAPELVRTIKVLA